MRVFIGLLLAGLAFGQQDIQLQGKAPYRDVGRGLVWGSSGAGSTVGINNNFIFTPQNPDEGICVFVANNNPTSAHSLTVSVHQTGDAQARNYTGNTGRFVADTVINPVSTIAASSMGVSYVHTNAGAYVVLSISGTTTQTGSPDTADVFIVETQHLSCGPSSPFTPQIPAWYTCGNTQARVDLADVGNSSLTAPTFAVGVNTTNTCLEFLHCVNHSASTVSLDITLGNGTTYIFGSSAHNFTLLSGSTLDQDFHGMMATGGIKWLAGASSSIACALTGVQ